MSTVWYSRSGTQNNEEDHQEESQEEVPNYKTKYRNLKRKLKFLIYENQCFQESLRAAQHGLLKVNRDNSFLLDRLLQYEKVDITSSESEETESSDDGEAGRAEPAKKKIKTEPGLNSHNISQSATMSGLGKSPSAAKKKRSTTTTTPTTTTITTKSPKQNIPPLQVMGSLPVSLLSDGHMTPEEVERHLESRQSYLELVPEKAPPTVPTEMFSNDPSLDSESNEICEFETSPSNLGDDCLSVDMLQE